MKKLLIIGISIISAAQAMDVPMSPRPCKLSPLQELQAGRRVVIGGKELRLGIVMRNRYEVMDTSADDMAICRFLYDLSHAENDNAVYQAIIQALEPGQIETHRRLKSILCQVARQTKLPRTLLKREKTILVRALRKAGLKENHEFNYIKIAE
ncbi:hypothetical protein JW872_02135 [Candidatus Babeliales bacterium]|nr:hypothetical protein [Candidatus Babeliales bacterium]